MKEKTIDNLIKKTMRAFLIAQIVVSVLMIVFGVGYAIRCAVMQSGAAFVFLFGCIAYVGYKLMFCSALKEYREARKNNEI